MLRCDQSKGADVGTHQSCRFQRAVWEPTDEVQCAAVRRKAYRLWMQTECRLSIHGERDCDSLAKVVADSRSGIEQVDGLVSHLVDCGGPIAFAFSAQLGERTVECRRVAYVRPVIGEGRLEYLLGGVPRSQGGFGEG